MNEPKIRGFKIDFSQHALRYMGSSLFLAKKEFEILILLMKRHGEIISRDEIFMNLYGGQDISYRTIDSHISHLRNKLRDLTHNRIQILASYGKGYRINYEDFDQKVGKTYTIN